MKYCCSNLWVISLYIKHGISGSLYAESSNNLGLGHMLVNLLSIYHFGSFLCPGNSLLGRHINLPVLPYGLHMIMAGHLLVQFLNYFTVYFCTGYKIILCKLMRIQFIGYKIIIRKLSSLFV